jgi:glycosyltransferase involved in cell wall biosynthesis
LIKAANTLTDVKQLKIRQIFEHGCTQNYAVILYRWIRSILQNNPLPLQCLIYASRREESRLIDILSNANFNTVYIESIRLYTVLAAVRKALPHAHIVIDMDDLLSRRYKTWVKNHLPIATGHLETQLPAILKKIIQKTRIASLILHYEYRALEKCEQNALSLADTVVLNSIHEAKLLQNRTTDTNIKACADIKAILPPVTYRNTATNRILPLRFVFIGPDRIAQNKISIDYLIDVWKKLRPDTPIHFYGKMKHPYNPVKNVFFHGFAENLHDVYTSNSILLSPAFLAGGIKTKVLESFSFGCPVIGTKETFEGIDLDGYSLALDQIEKVEAIIQKPEVYLDELNRCASIGNSFVRSQQGLEKFLKRWSDVLTLPIDQYLTSRRS